MANTVKGTVSLDVLAKRYGVDGKKRLIDTNQKKKKKRVIGVRESKRRQLIYDFYANAERGAMLILNDIRGIFTLRRQ